MSQHSIGLGPKEVQALVTLRQRLMPLVYQLENLKKEVGQAQAPPNWPHIQRSTAAISSLVNSVQSLLNDDPDTTKILSSLHPHPSSPFLIENPTMAAISTTILRKRPDINEERWILDRLAKAQEFAHVPSDWNIEPRKPPKDDGKNAAGDDPDGATTRTRRQRGTLNEDEIAELWESAADLVVEEMENVGPQSPSQSSSPEDTAMEGADAEGTEGQKNPKAIVALPMMPLEFLHKFMATGDVPKPGE